MKYILLGVIVAFLLISAFDKSLLSASELEELKVYRRYGYFSQEMGDLYTKNKVLRFYLNKFQPVSNRYLLKISRAVDIETYLPFK